VAALLVRYRLAEIGESIRIRQGRFAGRPSEMLLEVAGEPERIAGVALSGSVVMVASGRFDESVAAANRAA
jgi:predicted PhzF superfamily epimerase YddE/YHI9